MIDSKNMYMGDDRDTGRNNTSLIHSKDNTKNSLRYLNYKVHKLNGGKNIVIGNGLMARAFFGINLDKNILIFASGVSNSNEENISKFNEEKELFLDIYNNFPNHTIVYFSTCSIFDPGLINKPYVAHKKEMESLISKTASSFYILRLPIIVGKSQNPNTLTNYLYNNIMKDAQFNVWKGAKRHLIDIDDVYTITDHLISQNIELLEPINIAFHQYSIIDIISTLENILNKKAKYTLVDQGGSYDVDISKMNSIIPDIVPQSDKLYLDKILKKYYSG